MAILGILFPSVRERQVSASQALSQPVEPEPVDARLGVAWS
jgi:hypothetical protein